MYFTFFLLLGLMIAPLFSSLEKQGKERRKKATLFFWTVFGSSILCREVRIRQRYCHVETYLVLERFSSMRKRKGEEGKEKRKAEKREECLPLLSEAQKTPQGFFFVFEILLSSFLVVVFRFHGHNPNPRANFWILRSCISTPCPCFRKFTGGWDGSDLLLDRRWKNCPSPLGRQRLRIHVSSVYWFFFFTLR